MTDASGNAEREITLTRLFDAPRELVWEAFTDPEQVTRWWGPRGFTTTIHEMNVRPGGVWRFIMHGPDGVDYPNRIAYREVLKPERMVFSHGGDDEDEAVDFLVTVTFAEEDGKTRVTLTQLYDSAEARNRSVEEFHAIEGGNQTLDRLGEYLAKA